MTVLPISGGRKIPPLLRTPLRKNYCVEGDAVRQGKSCDLTLLNAAETVFLAATVPVLLSVNHNHGVFCQSCVSPYLRKYKAYEIPDGTNRLVAKSCL